jgi:soluble lytic murein transglycosylase-like protein
VRVALVLAVLVFGAATEWSVAHPMPRETRSSELWFAKRCGEQSVKAVKACIHRAAIHWQVSYHDGLYVAERESRFNPNICNTQGSGACGLFQFMPGTWAATPYGHYSVFDARANALAWAWAWSRGWQSHWGM